MANTENREQTAKAPRIHLHFLDGFRGLAALYVAFYHLNMIALESLKTFYPTSTHPQLKRAFEFLHITLFNHGHYAVVAFIVLSGFCLMLPLARSRNSEAAFDLMTFIKRRGKRILPPYYASVLFALGIIAFVPSMGVKNGSAWDIQLPAFEPGVLLSHLFLFHNLHADWSLRINSPLWSVALEWQIYFLFALILIPVWRRYGTRYALIAAFVLGLVPLMLPPVGKFQLASSQLITAFGLGMAAAVVAFQPVGRAAAMRERLPWLRYAMLAAAMIIAFLSVQRAAFQKIAFLRPLQLDINGLNWLADLAVALWSAILLIAYSKYLTEHQSAGETVGAVQRRPWLLRVFEHPVSVTLGAFSYSLYLFHAVFLNLFAAGVRSVAPTGTQFLLVYAVLAMPLAVAGAYGFYWLVERHCLNTRPTPRPSKETPPSPVAVPVGGVGRETG